ncbi:MAG: hypothetical protein AB1762_01480 [Gemmatimonadota bacterium]
MTRVALLFLLLPLAAEPQTASPRPQNPSPMVERTRAHERLTEQTIGGTTRRFTGPFGRPVEVWIPEQAPRQRDVHLIVHFLGSAWIPKQAAAQLRAPAVVAVVNVGAGSGVYHSAFSDPAAFDTLLAGVVREVAAASGISHHVRRLTLTGFSAGHGAIRVILRESRHFARVNDVLLMDGMHTAYVPEGQVLEKGGALDTTNLTIWSAFAKAAMAGTKRFVITHSEIFPGTFASTTETADWVLNAVDLRRTPVLQWGARGMQQLSEVRAGGFEMLGYAGNSAPDHIDHFHAMPELLARLLRAQP